MTLKKNRRLQKSKGKAAETAAVGTGTQFESVFKTLMDKIRGVEMNHAIYELYLAHLQACYAAAVERAERRVDDEVGKLRAELAHVLDPKRRFPWSRRQPADAAPANGGGT